MIENQQIVEAVTDLQGRWGAFQNLYVKDMEHLVRYAQVNFYLACVMLVLTGCSLYVSSRLKRAQQAVSAATKDLAERQSAVIVQLSVVAAAQSDLVNCLVDRVAALEAKLGIQPPTSPPPPPPQVLM